MKRLILMVAAGLLLAAPAAMAQKVNKDAIVKNLNKSNADIADAKKNGKAATWLTRGKVYYEAAYTPVKDLFEKMPIITVTQSPSFGNPTSTGEEKINGEVYQTMVYPYVTVYVKDDKVAAWKETQQIDPAALDTAIAAYAKAVELDPKAADKAKAGLKQISDYCLQQGNCNLNIAAYEAAAASYAKAYEAQSVPAFGAPEHSLLYYAGYFQTVAAGDKPELYAVGAGNLNKALAAGFADEKGDIYYYLFHCYYGQREADAANIQLAKETLLKGQQLFPKNDRIIEGLMLLYTSEKNVGDPAELISIIDSALAESPENIDLWFGRGRVFYALKNFDESIVSFKKVVELSPELFEGNYYLGVFYAVKGDAMNDEMTKKQYKSQSEYDNDLAAVNAVYAEALPWFEKAHEIKPDDADTVEFLKSICFRLRDEDGMMDKYNTYNALFKKMKGLE